jgi:hypothetical protein
MGNPRRIGWNERRMVIARDAKRWIRHRQHIDFAITRGSVSASEPTP